MAHPQFPPKNFMAKMAELLGEEFAQFDQSYTKKPAVGLRVNTQKLAAADFSTLSPFALKAVGEHEPAGFLVTGSGRPGLHPYHAAGLYYLQEPSAMVVGGLVRPLPGELVLDLAAAPGGKATHLATQMHNRGLLVANDIHRGRARLLAENLTRWGARNCLVTNAAPERLAAQFGPIFDRVLVDAPCSGEGMFRRSDPFEWSDAIVQACARRQTAVLSTAAQLVKPGGRLIYATCTFSPEENEAVICQFLRDRPQFEPVETPHFTGFSGGRPSWVEAGLRDERVSRCVRLWPHLFPGEGHFIAVLQNQGQEQAEIKPEPFGFKGPAKKDLATWQRFVQAFLQIEVPEERLVLVNGRLYLLPEGALATGRLSLIRYGLLLGEVRRGYFRPHHALALALTARDVTYSLNFSANSDEVSAYLQGRDFSSSGPDGWLIIMVDGYALGWGKRVNGRLKNHYPRGLRLMRDWRIEN